MDERESDMDIVWRHLPTGLLQRLPFTASALFLGGLLWVGSLWLPAFQTLQGEVLGYWLFITGWMGFAVFQLGWYANPVMLLAVLLMNHRPKRASLMALAAIIMATQSFWLHALPSDSVKMEITGLASGFWLWYLSILLLGMGVLLGAEETRRAQKVQKQVKAALQQNEHKKTGADDKNPQAPVMSQESKMESQGESEIKPEIKSEIKP